MNKGVSVRKKESSLCVRSSIREGKARGSVNGILWLWETKRTVSCSVGRRSLFWLHRPLLLIYRENTRVLSPPKKLYFPRFSSSGFELGRVRFYSFLPYSGNSAASLVTTQAQQQKRLDSGEEKAEEETLFSRVTLRMFLPPPPMSD